MTPAGRIGLLGGTLDPIHLGHLETARAARAALELDVVIVLPSRVPPHRPIQPVASAYHRFAMCALAVNGVAGLAASDLELAAPGPSYTVDTLTRFRDSSGRDRSQIFFITGADAFADIATWHRYPEVLDLAQFVVVSRPGHAARNLRERLPALAARMVEGGVPGSRFGVPGGGDTSIFLVDAVTPDVSSTEIRRRLAAGGTLESMVPAAVATHIHQHGLYAGAAPAANDLHGQN